MEGTTALGALKKSRKLPLLGMQNSQVQDSHPCNTCTEGRVPLVNTSRICASCREKKNKAYFAKTRESQAMIGLQKPKPMPDRSRISTNAQGKHERLPVLSVKEREPDLDYIEFQTATDMYKALKLQSKSKSLCFHGSFSIVAVSSIDNSKRGRLVTQELRKIAKLSFEYDKPTHFGSTIAYQCTCTARKAPQPRTSLLNANTIDKSAPSQKGKQKDLAVWAGLDLGATTSSPVLCPGKIFISSEDDHSHFLGIGGQKITVKVEH